LNNLASALESQGDYAGARPLYEQALAILKEVLGERHPDYASCLNSLAALLESQGDYAGARPLYEQALANRKQVLGERHPLYALSLNNLAMLLWAQGDYAGARPLHEKALAIRKEVQGERHPDYAQSLNNLAMLLYAQGDYGGARPHCEQALAIRKATLGERHPDTATSLNNLAMLLYAQGDSAAARPLFEQALAIRKELLGERHPDTATSLNKLAALLYAQGDYAGAAPLFKQALGISQGNLELAAAAQSERQQLAMARQLGGKLGAYLSLGAPAKLSPEDAYRYVLAAKGTVFERQQRLRTQRRRLRIDPQSEAARRLTEYQETVARLATLALATPDPQQAPAWRAKVAELARRKDELEAVLARLDAGFRGEQAEARRTPAQLRAALPRGTALVDFLVYTAFTPPAQGKGKFQQERRLVAFVVRPDRPIARIDLGPIAPILEAIKDWRAILAGRRVAPSATGPALMLRRLIWEPVEPLLDGIVTVLVSPDGSLGLIPLAALPGQQPDRYLIEEWSIAVVPVPRMLGSAATAAAPSQGNGPAQPEPAPSLLLAGDIDYGGDPGTGVDRGASRSAAVATRAGLLPDFTPLPATRGEILEVRDSFEEHFPSVRAAMIRGAKATEEALRREAPRHRFLHLATHGYFAPQELRSALGPEDLKRAQAGIDLLGGAGVAGYHPGLLSGIALAGANRRPTPIGQDDGILTALEVAELDLSGVELAVLSACETGLGEVAGGEGPLGLQRAFQVAGAQAVVASLWKVGDEPTRALMARFYEDLWRKGRPPAEALRAAQLYLLREGLRRGVGGIRREDGESLKSGRLPPFYWAGFVLSTDHP
jgi:CHAT domain-containing protein/Flp pilus assembly protein TadD